MFSKLQQWKDGSIRTHVGPPERYQLQPRRENLDRLPNDQSKLRRFTLGTRDERFQNRTVLLVGATGSGKSTLINALVNFVMGAKFEDKVWFEIIADEQTRSQADSQTSEISVYEVFGFEGEAVPYSLTIIDTPGYGDTRGKDFDDIVTCKLQDLFSVPEGVAVIDMVGLVLKASENRLDDRMAYIFNSVTSLFGKDMEKNIVAMMTHSDGEKPTNALRALMDAGIKCARNEANEPVFFQFNNRQKEKIEKERAARYAFETSEDGLKDLTDFLGRSKPRSLKETVKVMKERIRLTACMQNLKERVSEVEMKQREIQANRRELEKFKEAMKANKNFTFQAKETYKGKEDIDAWWDTKAVTCSRCEENCHHPGCTWAWGPSWCEVMDDDGKCTSCSGRCAAEHHVKEGWKYVTRTRTVTKTKADMEQKYKANKAQSEEKIGLLERMEKEMMDHENLKNHYLDAAFHIIEQLERIALNTDAMSTYVHLEFLIEKMKERNDQSKLQKLVRMRERMSQKDKAAADYYKMRSSN